MRECGECTKCCDGYLESPNIGLGPNPCKFITPTGCSDYENRPDDPCRQFVCEWLRSPNIYPDEMRPDKSNLIIILQAKGLLIVEIGKKPVITTQIKLNKKTGLYFKNETNLLHAVVQEP